ncbi:MAG: ABC transporter substrate-binding protein [Alphaproteobacteria bacterium]|nr:ABC transporter substrate-binding protein [Alphaproteobacteria bacterium]
MLRIFILLLFSVFICRASFADVNVVVIAPQDGRYEAMGSEIIEGAKIAIDDINNNGGIKGRKLNLITVFDQCDDVLSLSTAQMISISSSKEDKASVVIGPYCSNSFEEISDTFAKAKIFQIIPNSVGTNNYKQNHKGLVKMLGSKERQGSDFFNFYKENMSGKKVALIYDSDDRDIVDIAAVVQGEFRKAELSEMFKPFDVNKYKSSESLAKSVTKHYDVAYILGNVEEVIDVFKEIKERDSDFIIFTNRYQLTDEYSEKLGSLAEGSYSIGLPSLKDNPSFTEKLVEFRLLGIEPEGLSVYSYSAVKLWQDLVVKADSFSYDALSKLLESDKFQTTWGEVEFKNGSPEDLLNYSIYKVSQGHFEQVK